jgi:hypothetical protein
MTPRYGIGQRVHLSLGIVHPGENSDLPHFGAHNGKERHRKSGPLPCREGP